MSLTHFHYHHPIHFLKFQGEFLITPPISVVVPHRYSKMGGKPSKHRRSLCEKNGKGLKKKKKSSSSSSEKNAVVYEKEMMGFAFKKAEWKEEKKKLKEEVKMLRGLVDEKDDKIREIEQGLVVDKCSNVEKEWAFLGANFLVDQMEQERARRDHTVEKWKQLYLAIKMELDDLIKRTHEGGLYWRAEEEDMAEELKRELQSKEETIDELKSKLVSMEQEMFKRDREVDILRQSLRIMTSKKVVQTNKKLPKKTVITQGGNGKL